MVEYKLLTRSTLNNLNMSKVYIFGIGGTGARVLRSFTMMMASGVKLGVGEIVPIIIDPDAANADLTRTVALMNKYRNVRSHLTFSDNIQTLFFRTGLSQILPSYTLKISDTGDKTFQQFIDLSSIDRQTQAFLRMLFSERNLTSSMEVGFKGNPNIGSVVLNQIVKSTDFETFANGFSQGDKIFIISSIFGGTGASGFPLLLKTLRTGNSFSNFDIINNAEIGAITILPYFKLKSDSNSEIDSSAFISKAKSALAYYENNIINNDSINVMYYIADDMANTYDNHEGGASQQNAAHLIEFLAATSIVDFCSETHPGTINKELGLKDFSGNVTFSSFYERQRNELFAPLTEFLMLANCLNYKYSYYSSKEFNANDDNFNDIYNSSFMSELRDMTKEYIGWLKEMKDNKRSLELFNLAADDKPFDIIVGVNAKKIRSLKSDYALVTSRLNSAIKQCHSNGDCNKFMEMYFLGLSRLVKEKFNV